MADLRSLRVLATVVRRASFTDAAADLHVAQQSVSRTIAALEAELGVSLVERTTRSVSPTLAGRTLAREAERILADVDDALARAREIGRGDQGTVRIALSPAIGSDEVTRIVTGVRDALPGVELSLVDVRPAQVVEELTRDRADLVVARTVPSSADIESAQIGTTEAALAMPAGHPLAGRVSVDLAELDGAQVVVWTGRSAFTQFVVDAFAQRGAAITPVTATVLGRGGHVDVAEGRGVALVAAGDMVHRDVVLVPVRPVVALPVLGAWRRGTHRPTVARLREVVAAALAGAQAGQPRT